MKAQLSLRLREVRQELFGDHGGPEMARRLGLPSRTWYNYETGVTVPAEVLLSFIDQTGTDPVWLLTGVGPKFRRNVEEMMLDCYTPQQLIRRGLEKLEQSAHETAAGSIPSIDANGESRDYVTLPLIPLEKLRPDLTSVPEDVDRSQGVVADPRWIPRPDQTIATRILDDGMTPILPRGSIVAIDLTLRDPSRLIGRLVAAIPLSAPPMIRFLGQSGKSLILRPTQKNPAVPTHAIAVDGVSKGTILGQVVWSWTQFDAL